MEVVKAKWFNDADSPVVLMVDDLSNLWFDLNENGRPDVGEDWGYWRDEPGSSFAFLQSNLLDRFPEIKATFFTVAGSPIICEYSHGRTYRGRINENRKVASFFRRIHGSTNLEIAYHGLTHAVIENGEYVNEWCSFNSVAEALRNIEDGQRICEEVFGERLEGGKYPGYASNIYSDESIDKAGFLWWCRHWTYDRFMAAGGDYAVFDMKVFGESGVVDFPSTVNPAIWQRNPLIRKAQLVFRNPRRRLARHLEGLLHSKNVISVQEHAGAIKGDGKRQTPNIIDDMPSLRYIFSFLKDKNVWHATCSEIADYYTSFTSAQVEVAGSDFRIKNLKGVGKHWLTLLLDKDAPLVVMAPSGRSYKAVKHPCRSGRSMVNVIVEDGCFQVR